MSDETSVPGDDPESFRERLERLAREAEAARAADSTRRLARIEDFLFDTQQEAFWDTEDNTLHSDKGVDAKIPQSEWTVRVEEAPEVDPAAPPRRGRPRGRRETFIRPSQEIMRVERDLLVEGSTWWPGKPKIIRDWFIDKDGAYPAKGRRSFNQYRPAPAPDGGDPEKAGPWLAHLARLWPIAEERDAFLDYAAHLLQRPEVKANHGVLLSGEQGTGKDAALAPLLMAVGEWNAKSIDADQVLAPFQPWLQTLVLVVNEIRPSDHERGKASAIYNVMKTWTTEPPKTLPVNDKYTKLRHIVNLLRVFVTTNHRFAFRLEADDRRWLVLHTTLPTRWNVEEGDPGYFVRYFAWLDAGGWKDVAAYLGRRDLSRFDPKARPFETEGWRAIVRSWAKEDGLSRAMAKVPNEYAEDGTPSDERGSPSVVFAKELLDLAFDDKDELSRLLGSTRERSHRFDEAGYEVLPNPSGADEWRRSRGGVEWRSKVAFYRAADFPNENAAGVAARRRLEAIVAAAQRPSGQPTK